ncbi:MAG TPA: hypothetical protein VLK82_17115 [Candidatus Tectomicrobia bacterium]|nr:hypothetical protein [Candidatus Tectomicrobia bacterium]
MRWGVILRWIDLAVFVGVLALIGRVRLHLSDFNRFFLILLALSALTTLVFVWTSEEPRSEGD